MERLPIKYEDNFIGKIKKFFRNLFFKKENVESEYTGEDTIVNISKSNIFDDMQNEYKKFENEKFIIEQTIRNPRLIINLSQATKEKLNELYDKKILENNKIIAMNNKKILNLKERIKASY